MSIIGAFMVPHPPIILPEIGHGEEEKISKTTQSFCEVAKRVRALAPDTIIIISPHSTMYADYFHISPGRSAKGSMAQFRAPLLTFRVSYDEELVITAAAIAESHGFPAGPMGEQGRELDHGTMIPLYFINQEYTGYKLVRVGLSGLPLTESYRMGKILQEAANQLSRKVVVIGSGDLSHKCRAEGPYGYDPAGPEYDRMIIDTMGRGNFGELLDYEENFCNKAAECGHRSFCIMAGALDGMEVDTEALSYEDTFGVGYGVCCYTVTGRNEERHFLQRKETVALEKIALQRKKADAYVRLAISALETYIRTGNHLTLSQKPAKEYAKELIEELPVEMLEQKAGTFVSIHKFGQLRGCIGTIAPTTDCIAQEIMRNAVAAATVDSRFEPISLEEIPYLEVSVDVLGASEPIDDSSMLDVKKYGVIVSQGYKRGLLLPNLEGVDTIEDQIAIAMRKAGLSDQKGMQLERFEVVRHETNL